MQVTRFLGLEFILQLCVEDDERAGTILAVSNKYVAHTPTLIDLFESGTLGIMPSLPLVPSSNTRKAG